MNNHETTSTPATCSQPVGVTAGVPDRSGAARGSQPAEPLNVIAAIDWNLREARRGKHNAIRSGYPALISYWKWKIAVLLKRRKYVASISEKAEPAGNEQEEPR